MATTKLKNVRNYACDTQQKQKYFKIDKNVIAINLAPYRNLTKTIMSNKTDMYFKTKPNINKRQI